MEVTLFALQQTVEAAATIGTINPPGNEKHRPEQWWRHAVLQRTFGTTTGGITSYYNSHKQSCSHRSWTNSHGIVHLCRAVGRLFTAMQGWAPVTV